jgi:hypothetical protein
VQEIHFPRRHPDGANVVLILECGEGLIFLSESQVNIQHSQRIKRTLVCELLQFLEDSLGFLTPTRDAVNVAEPSQRPFLVVLCFFELRECFSLQAGGGVDRPQPDVCLVEGGVDSSASLAIARWPRRTGARCREGHHLRAIAELRPVFANR